MLGFLLALPAPRGHKLPDGDPVFEGWLVHCALYLDQVIFGHTYVLTAAGHSFIRMAGDFSCARTRDQGSCGLELHQAILSSLRLIWVVKALDNISMSFEGCQHHSSLPMNVPEFDVCAGLVEVLDVVSVSHPGCPHPSSFPVIFPDVDI